MKAKTKLLFILLTVVTVTICVSSCNNGNPTSTSVVLTSTKGAYVLSEGSFTTGSSMLSFYSSVKDTFYSSIFSNGTLGFFPDGMLYNGNNIYVTEQGNFNGPGKLHKLDTNGRVITSSSPFGKNPYSLVIANSKIYVTNGPASNVSVLDVNSLAEIKTISVGVYPQEIAVINNKVFVGNKSAFGGAQDSSVSVIDVTKDSVVATLIVKKDPSSLCVTNDGKLLVGCPSPAGIIYEFDPSSYIRIDSVVCPTGFVSDICTDRNGYNVYYYIGGSSGTGDKIVMVQFNNKTFTTIINAGAGSSYYGYGYDSDNKKHFVLDAKSFTVNGSMYVYDYNYNLLKTFTTGVSPRRVIFKRD